MKAEEIILLTDGDRRKLTLKKRKRKRYNREKRPVRSRDELVAYLRDNGFKSTRQLLGGRSEGDPNVYDYLKEFKTWNAAKLAAFGPPGFAPEIDAEYVAKTVIQFGLWTYDKYRKARAKRPDIVPSYYEVRKRWGKFSNLIVYAEKVSMCATLESYRNFKRRLGAVPTMDQCRKEGVDLSVALEFFGSKKSVDAFVNQLESVDANK
jgi:hypothetical protein